MRLETRIGAPIDSWNFPRRTFFVPGHLPSLSAGASNALTIANYMVRWAS